MAEYRILYVDDDRDIREVASMSLSLDPQFTVRTCSSGAEGVATAEKWRPHLILLDVMMPELDGPETLGRLKAKDETAEIPVIFITARAQTHEIGQLLAHGAIGVIPKPFDPMSLAGDVRKYLDPASARK